MRGVTVETQTWIAARGFLLDRCDDFYLHLTRTRETFDPEAIHDLRVASRRLREGITIFAHCFRKRQVAPLRKELKALTVRLGSIRNTDEALLFFTPLIKNCEAASTSAIINIVATLQAKRWNEQRELKLDLKKIDPGSLLSRIDYLCNHPSIFNPDADYLFMPIADYLLDAIAQRAKTIMEILPEALTLENVAAQHRLRIAVKRFRYRLEFLAPMASADYSRIYSLLKEYQEILGHMHDLDVFSGLSGEMACEGCSADPVKNIISSHFKMLFVKFIDLNAAKPLAEIGCQVRGLL